MAADELDQDLYVRRACADRRVMVKDENVCLHCGLCRALPYRRLDMQRFLYQVTKAGQQCSQSKR